MTLAHRFGWPLLVLLSLGGLAPAQLPPGRDGYSFPAGGRAGTTVDVTLGGTDWTPDARFIVHDPRVKLELLGAPSEVLVHEPPYWFDIKSFANDPRLPREVRARLHLPANHPGGLVRWSVVTASGAGPGGLFMVGTGPELVEDERRAEPQPLPRLPITINGRLGRIEEVDRYEFTATASGPVSCELFARRLGHDFHGQVQVTHHGKVVAEALDTEGRDPALTFRAEQGQRYTVAVRELDYRGYRNFTYRLEIRPGPRLIATLPAAGQRGQSQSIEFIGYGIATGQPQLERLTRIVAFPVKPELASLRYTLETPHGHCAPIELPLSDLAEQLEPASPELSARLLTLPSAITGRIAQRGEQDRYRFLGKKGEMVQITLQARTLGSSLEPTVIVRGPDGKPLPSKAPSVGAEEWQQQYRLPVDGEYQILLHDQSGQKPGLEAVYRLTLQQPKAGLALSGPPIVNVPIGGTAAVKLQLDRQGDFQGPVTLTLGGLPEGIAMPKSLVIPEKASSFDLPLECAKTAGVSASQLTISGEANINGQKVTVPLPELLVATTLKPPFKVKAAEADGGRRVPRGSTHRAEVLIERTDGFTGEIILDMAGNQQRHRQGIRGPAFTVPANRSQAIYPVFLPEWLETTRTSRLGLVAMARINDPQGKPHYVLDAMQGQITMSIEGALLKLTMEGDEPTLTPGQPLELPVKLARSPQLLGPLKVELIVPPELRGVVSAEPQECPAEAERVLVRVMSQDAAVLKARSKLTLRATGSYEGYPVVAETELDVAVLRSTASRK